ncbi:MAG: HEAT repeat domain-containing protein [Chloroflexota bacterium]|nr:HEAT repeat domain-containing protein [Chloroflexota bacterium]
MLYITYSTIRYLPGYAPAPQLWRFDMWSALIGAAVAFVLAWLVYRLRDALRLGWETVTSPLVRLRHRLQASDEDHYRELVAKRARSLTILARVAPLDAVFVEPKLLSPTPTSQPTSEIEPVPLPLQALPLHRILEGHPQLVILGYPGAGRTTLLTHLAFVCARATNENVPPVEAGTTLGQAHERLPLYVPLPAMDWDETDSEEEQSKQGKQKSDEVERLVRAALAAVGGSSGLGRPMHQSLEAGQSIVLADGWDELSPQQRQQAAAWLADLVAALPGNLWLVSAGMRGYAPLTEAGFIPLTLASWDARQVEAFTSQWVDACAPANESPTMALRELTATLRLAARAGSSPLELALRAFVYLSDGQAPAKRAALFARALDLLLWQEQEDQAWLSAACRVALGQVALDLQQEGRTTASREEIEAAIEAALPPPEERPARAVAHVFRTLTGERGLLHPTGTNRYAFVHSLWQAYLAARQMVAIAPTSLIERLDDSRWADVLHFYVELGDMGPLVTAWLRSPDDMFHTHLCTLSSWISVAPEDAAWRNGAMAVLARGFLQPDQPALTRQALAEALAATGVPGVIYLFKQALEHPNVEIRTAATSGLARVADEADLADIEEAMNDNHPAVRQAAVRGLAYLSIDAATRLLERVLLEGDETLRQVAAIVLAGREEEGIDFLRDVAESGDVMARRAAVFGLAQSGARDMLEKMAREDEQWIVRSGASMALAEMEEREKHPKIAPPPKVERLPWLISWAASQGTGVGVGDAARQVLLRALVEGEPSIRQAAAQTLAQVGRPYDVEPLLSALADPDPAVTGAASEALAEIGRRYDLRIEQVSKRASR